MNPLSWSDVRWFPLSVKYRKNKRLFSVLQLCAPLMRLHDDPHMHSAPVSPFSSPQVWSMDGYYKGRRVLEYRTMGDFAKAQNFVQHLLPHAWAGTGHVVYNGSLYYNKHQSNILVGAEP